MGLKGQNLSEIGQKSYKSYKNCVQVVYELSQRQNKILLLDEATASVDVETDYKIQATIKEAFNHCTVITIAHRIHTVMNYDSILVLKKGEVVEFGTPQELLQIEDGLFKSMVKSAQMESE